MADLSDVERALVETIAAGLYPSGPEADSVVGTVCRVYRGWPVAASLEADLGADVVNVSVFPVPGTARNTTRWPIEEQVTHGPPTLTATVLYGVSAQFAGSAGPGQLAGLLIDGVSFVYRTAANDTPSSVATVLARAVQAAGSWTVSRSQSTVTVLGTGPVVARTAIDGSVLREVRRQQQEFRISVWCGGPHLRDAASRWVDASLAAVDFLSLPDGSSARLRAVGTSVFDDRETASLYRRDLLVTVEYATTLGVTQPSMLFGDVVLNGTTFLV